MIRLQIQVEEPQAAQLRELAARRGVSSASIIRDALDRILAVSPKPPQAGQLSALATMFRSGSGDVSERHDDYLSQAFDSRP